MPTIKVDFSDVEQQDRTPIKPGKYDVVVEEIEVRQAEGKDHPYLNWKLAITEGEYEGRNLYLITSLSPKAIFRLQEVLQSFGIDEEEMELDVDDDTNLLLEPDLVGEGAVATVRNQLYEGKPQARVVTLDGGQTGEEEEAPKPKKKKAAAKTKPKAAEPEDDDEDEDDDEEEAEEEEKPARKAAPAKRTFATKSKARPTAKKKFR